MLQHSAFTLAPLRQRWPGKSRAIWLRAGWRIFMSLALVAAGVGFWPHLRVSDTILPIPVTMQTLAVMVIAMAYGSKLGTATLFSYLLTGFLGAPVFAGGAGFAYMVGPTGGYLAGFLVSSVVLGALADRGWTRNWQTTAAAMIVGTAITLCWGLPG